MFARFGFVLLAGMVLAACQTTYRTQNQAIQAVLGSGLTNTYVNTTPYQSGNRADGAYCQDYRIRQSNSYGQVRYGLATVCKKQTSGWFLAGHSFDGGWINANAPIPTPSYPVANPSYPVQNPSYPVQNPTVPVQPTQPAPMPPAPAPGQPGQWVPVTQ